MKKWTNKQDFGDEFNKQTDIVDKTAFLSGKKGIDKWCLKRIKKHGSCLPTTSMNKFFLTNLLSTIHYSS